MENDDAVTTNPALDENDVMAIEAILMRTIRSQDEAAQDRAEVERLNARIAANAQIRDSAYAALQVFGFESKEGVNRWDLVRDAIGVERYGRALPLHVVGSSSRSLKNIGGGEEVVEKEHRATRSTIPIRTAVLEYLRGVDEGATARQVRQHLLSAHGLEVHERRRG